MFGENRFGAQSRSISKSSDLASSKYNSIIPIEVHCLAFSPEIAPPATYFTGERYSFFTHNIPPDGLLCSEPVYPKNGLLPVSQAALVLGII